jgi:GAF domain-containing protein/HAMP domain-containing protein
MISKNLTSEQEAPSPEQITKRTNAFRIAAAILGGAAISMVFNLFLAVQSGDWRMYGAALLTLVISAFAIGGLRFIRDGQYERGIWTILIGMMAVLPFGTLLVSELGFLVGLVLVITSYVYASQTLSKRDVRRVLLFSIGIGLLTAATDYLQLEYRQPIPVLKTFMPVITALVLVVIGSFAVLRAWRRGLRTKLLIVLTGTVVVLIAAITIANFVSTRQEVQEDEVLMLQRLYNEYNDDVAASEISAAALSTALADRPDIKQLYLANDRQGLLRLLTPIFEQLRDKYDIRHLYIETTDGTVFVRVHNPANFGDDVTYRATASTALASQETVAGVDIGPNRIGVRSVSPLVENGSFVGMLEIGLDYDKTFIDHVKAHTGADYTLWIANDAAAAAGLQPDENAFSSPSPDMFFYTSTFATPVPVDQEVYQQVVRTGESQVEYVSTEAGEVAVLVAPLLGYGNRIIGVLEISISRAEVQSAIQSELRLGLLTASLSLLIGMILIWFASQNLVLRPLDQLAAVAHRQLEGDLGARTNITTGDELEQLGRTLNALTSQLQETLSGLEQRVAARTRDLTTVAEVGTAAATILQSGRLLQEVVDLTKERFNLYHSHIYLLDEKGENLVLTAGAGEPGRVMVAEGRSIPLDREQSLVARAARERHGVSVNDVTQAPDFLPNPLLPDTRAELAVPMIVGGRVIGVFDIQSEQVGRFTDSDINIQTTLAAQMATSIQNVRSFERSRKQAELESLVNVIGQKIQRTTSIEETLQTAVRELGTAVGASRVKASVRASSSTDSTGMASSH